MRIGTLLLAGFIITTAHAADRIVFHNGKTIDCRVIAFANGDFICEFKDGITNRLASSIVRQVVFDAPDQPQAGDPKVWEEEVELVGLVDDGCDIFLNGEPIGFTPGKSMTLRVREGDVLAVKAWDMQGGTAGGFALSLTRKNGKSLVTGTQWLTSNKKEDQWNAKNFNDKAWQQARKAPLKWLEDAVQKQFGNMRKPVCIWGQGGNVYFRKTIKSVDFQ